MGWSSGERASKGQSHKVDAERTSELLVTSGFTHTIPIFPSHKVPNPLHLQGV